MSYSHTNLTSKEAEVLEIARETLETIRRRYSDGGFCTGYAWAAVNGIAMALGDPRQEAPWRGVEARTDETVTGDSK